jgi:four helix bundle protein
VFPIPRLKVSVKAHELALRVHEQTRSKPWAHDPVVRESLQRAALAVALHITRGARDEVRTNFPRALDAALASLGELSYCLVLARDLALLGTSAYAMLEARSGELERMLIGLRSKVRSSGSAPRAARTSRVAGHTRRSETLQADRAAQPVIPQLGAPLGVA